MTSIDPAFVQFLKCVHYGTGLTSPCPGFPNGIPMDILTGDHNHRKEYPGDGGFRFEPLSDTRAQEPGVQEEGKAGSQKQLFPATWVRRSVQHYSFEDPEKVIGVEDRVDQISDLCLMCRHLEPIGYPVSCKAFPDGIPEPILLGRADHRTPFNGDNGIHFESYPEGPEPLKKIE